MLATGVRPADAAASTGFAFEGGRQIAVRVSTGTGTGTGTVTIGVAVALFLLRRKYKAAAG
ncbi:hypothetical protein [Streptomyces sp. NPDC093097]|uniref:hypothetical protein n=1 Tax=Streptomyces sp. NPDC093097 TaxID=3366027 RepID=UPI0037F1E06B